MLRRLMHPVLQRIDEVRHIAVELDRALPLVRNSIESQNAELRAAARYRADVRAELDQIQENLLRTHLQIEALRDELALTIGAPSVPLPVSATDGTRGLRLCFGGDAQSASDHTAVDLGDASGTRLAADLRGLSFAPQSAAEIRAARILERFSPADLREFLLPYWRGLLMPGADLVATDTPAEELDSLLRLLQETGYGTIETVSRWRDGVAEVVEVRAKSTGRVVTPADLHSGNSEVHAR